MELIILEEFEAVGKILAVQNLPLWWTHIGAMTKSKSSKTVWYWINSGKKVSFNIPWAKNEPNFDFESEWCLTLAPNVATGLKFHDTKCFGCCENSFICHKVKASTDECEN